MIEKLPVIDFVAGIPARKFASEFNGNWEIDAVPLIDHDRRVEPRRQLAAGRVEGHGALNGLTGVGRDFISGLIAVNDPVTVLAYGNRCRFAVLALKKRDGDQVFPRSLALVSPLDMLGGRLELRFPSFGPVFAFQFRQGRQVPPRLFSLVAPLDITRRHAQFHLAAVSALFAGNGNKKLRFVFKILYLDFMSAFRVQLA